MTGINSGQLDGYGYLVLIVFLVGVGSFLIVAFSHYFAKYVFIHFLNKTIGRKNSSLWNMLFKHHVFYRIAYLIPAFIIYHFAYLFNIEYPHFKLYLADLVSSLTFIYIMIGVALVLSALLNCVNERYERRKIAKQRPIKSYLQVVKILLFIVTGILCVSVLFEQSPAYFFTGIGAATAIIVLIFKDSILGFVASVQLAAYDMVRIGDWIEMPGFGADGEVLEISLNTVKVQNSDKTIVTIPSYALLTSGIKNWRGMQEAGGRRIKRSILIDLNSIKVCDSGMLQQYGRIDLIKDKVKQLVKSEKQIINLSLFRYYIEAYLHQHLGVHKDMKIIIRQLQATSAGLPLEISCFTNKTDSIEYENIQADIFEHLYAALPLFHLRVFQYSVNGSGSE
ncbi:MAG: mechanosensitive ion channel family protein [Gammaproteobacteria bacterium]